MTGAVIARTSRRDFLRQGLGASLALAATRCGVDQQRTHPRTPRLRGPYAFGLHVDERHLDGNLARAENLAGRGADTVLIFAKLGEPVNEKAKRLMDAGYEVALTLEWWNGRQASDPAYSLRQIAAGRHDAALHRWLRSFRGLPRPIHLRPLHEFNGDWYPWGVFSPGNAVEDLGPAWRHLVSRARQVADDRVLMQFCYNRLHAQNRDDPLASFYPGDDWVDEIVINGYMRPGKRRWKSFAEINGPFYEQVKAINPDKPLWIGETACTEAGGDKAAWITAMFDALSSTHPVACLTWFDEYVKVRGQPDRDWPFDTSPAALQAFRRGVRLET